MKKPNKVLIPFLAIGAVLYIGYKDFGFDKYVGGLFLQNPSFIIAVAETDSKKIKEASWQVLETYISYVKNHDLEGTRRLSYKLSDTCKDESKIQECYGLMDSVYNILSQFKKDDFKNVLWNANKIILFTDIQDGMRMALFFSRSENGPKIAGMKICQSDDSSPDECSSL